jgi:HK97 family phage portal protein
VFLSNGSVVPNPGGTLADVTPMFADASYYAQTALALESTFAAYGALYKSQLWVGIVVRKKAMATARMPFQIMRQGKGVLQSVESGSLADLMEDPNPEMSGFDLWRWTSSTRDIYGEAFWRKIRDQDGRVRELWPMHPNNVIVRRAKDGGLEYVYAPGARVPEGIEPMPASDVVAFTAYNPDTLARGLSSLESLRMTLLNEDASRRATASFWHKGARPSMILTHPETLSAGAQKRLKEKAEANMGGADRMGGVTVFEEGIVPHSMQLNMEEMQYVESRKLNREEVCAAYDISPLVVHILDHATFSNVTEQLRSQYRDSMAPWFTELESTVNKQLVPDFYPRTGSVKVKTRFNMDDVLRGDYETRATAAMGLRQGGVNTGNETRVIMGQDPIDDPNMDLIFANAALQPLGQPKEQLAIEAPVAEEPADPVPADKPGMVPNPPKPNGRTSRRAAAAARSAGSENQKEQ